MTQEERLEQLAALLEQQQRLSLEQICQLLNISRDSARRDLLRLCENPRYQRLRGGVRLAAHAPGILPFAQRPAAPWKQQLAERVVSTLPQHGWIYLDSGSTLLAVANVLAVRSHQLHIITPALAAAQALSQHPHLQLILLGGSFDATQGACYGSETLLQLSQYRLDVALLGICALDDKGLTAPSAAEAQLKRQAIQQAEQRIALGSCSKLGQHHRYQVCALTELDALYLDQPPPASFCQQLEAADIHLTTLEPSDA